MNSMPIEQKTVVGKCFIIYANRMIYLPCYIFLKNEEHRKCKHMVEYIYTRTEV